MTHTSTHLADEQVRIELVRAHDAAIHWRGHGKAKAFAARANALDAYRGRLVAAGLDADFATDPDVLDIALGKTTVEATNARYQSLREEL